MMNHTTLALIAVLAAAALVIGAVATPAFAGGYKKRDQYDKQGDSSATITKQINKQKQVLSGFVTFGSQDASNCIVVANGPNACREQALGGLGLGEEQ
jgi:hypothetical protein